MFEELFLIGFDWFVVLLISECLDCFCIVSICCFKDWKVFEVEEIINLFVGVSVSVIYEVVVDYFDI